MSNRLCSFPLMVERQPMPTTACALGQFRVTWAMPVDYRPAHLDELQKTQEHIVRSINDLTERHGFGSMASVRPADFQRFCWHDDPTGLWTAERNGEMAGSAFSWVCGDLWSWPNFSSPPMLKAKE